MFFRILILEGFGEGFGRVLGGFWKPRSVQNRAKKHQIRDLNKNVYTIAHVGRFGSDLGLQNGLSWAHLGLSWAHFGVLWAPLGLLRGHFGVSWAHFGLLWAPLGLLRAPRGPRWHQDEPKFRFLMDFW